MARADRPLRWLKPAAHLVAALPAMILLWGWVEILWLAPGALTLSAEPVAYTHNALGLAAFRLLLASLACTPIRILSGWAGVMQLRRLLGLWAFAYAVAHLGFYLAMELGFSLSALWAEAMKRRFIFFGLAAFLALLPLALTSTRAAVKRLGGRRWQRLHRLAYVAALAAAVHFLLRVKGFQIEPWAYLALLGLLLAVRLGPSRTRASP